MKNPTHICKGCHRRCLHSVIEPFAGYAFDETDKHPYCEWAPVWHELSEIEKALLSK